MKVMVRIDPLSWRRPNGVPPDRWASPAVAHQIRGRVRDLGACGGRFASVAPLYV